MFARLRLRRPASIVGAGLLLATCAAPSVTFAITFNLIGNTNTQVMNTYSAGGSFCQFTSSASAYSVNGMISSNNHTLSWTGLDRLEVTDRVNMAITGGTSSPCYDNWAAINADDFPLEFMISDGDPTKFLKITPRAFGAVTYNTGIGGWPSNSILTMELRMVVSLNGQVVSQDRLFLEKPQTTGQVTSWNLELPKGGLNTVMIPPGGAANGNVITVDLFVFRRVYGDGTVYAVANSSYGNQMGIIVTAEALGPVAVGDQSKEPLSLGVRPNPSAASARISYSLPRAGRVELAVYDLRGARVATLVDGVEEAGHHEVALARSSADRGRLVSGIYLVELRAGDEHRTSKFVLTE